MSAARRHQTARVVRAAQRAPAVALAVALAAGTATPAAAAPFENTIAQRVQACTGCHGAQGRAASDGYYPRIAGKPAQYLFNQLVSFRDGRRDYALMTNLLAPLDDAYLHEIADHFAALDVPYPPPQPATGSVDALSRGETLVTRGDAARKVPACAACHGAALMGVAPATPALLGMPRDYLNAQLGAWRTGKRQAHAPDCMAEVARRLAPEDISALSQWLAAQTVPPGAKPAGSAGTPPLDCGGIDPAPAARPAGAGAAR